MTTPIYTAEDDVSKMLHYRELTSAQREAKARLLKQHINLYQQHKLNSDDDVLAIMQYDKLKKACIHQYNLLLSVSRGGQL